MTVQTTKVKCISDASNFQSMKEQYMKLSFPDALLLKYIRKNSTITHKNERQHTLFHKTILQIVLTLKLYIIFVS